MKRKGNVLITVSAFFAAFFVMCAFAIDFSMIVVTRSQLQSAVESAVLAAAGDIAGGTAQATAVSLIEYNKINGAQYAQVAEIRINDAKQAIWVSATAPARTYFLSALGISTIDLHAQSAAIVEPYIINQDTDFMVENQLQYTSPSLIFSKSGSDLKITRSDETKEYRVFAGLKDTTGQAKWVEITCSSSDATAKEQYFDLNAQCVADNVGGAISVAQVFRVVNNREGTPLEVEQLELTGVAKLIRTSVFNAL